DPPYHFFIEEAPELLQAIENGLLTIRQDRSAAKVHEIMRAAHSLKGGAASVGLNGIKAVAHRLEDIFKALYSDDLVLDETLESRLLEAYDALRQPLEEQISTGYYDPNAAWQQAQPIITAIETQLGDRLAAGDQFMPSSADLGVDIVSSLFDVDIRQGIEAVRTARQSGDQAQLLTVLTNQSEVFVGLAEILNLPGFKGIAEAVQRALAVNPDQLLAITDQALLDWQNSCEQVLQNGDRQQGGNASPQLLALGVREEKEAIYQPSSSPKVLSDLFFGDDDEAVEIPPTVIEAEAPTVEAEIPVAPQEETETPLVELSDTEADDAFAALMDLGDELSAEPVEVESPADTVIDPPTLPSLEDVFGGLTPDSVQSEAVVFADLDPDQTALEEANLLAVLQAVEQEFEQLPPSEETFTEVPPPAAITPITESTPPEHSPERRAVPRATNPANLSIRVDFQRLERMNNWVGELAINRNSLSLQNDQLQSSVRSLLSRFSRFQGMTNKLRELADQLVIAPDRREKMAWISNAFDSLEMDSYGALSGQLQEILEEMMQLEESVDDIVLFARASNQSLDAQKQMLFSLRDELMWARMLPLGEILNRFPRVLRDMSTKFKKPVQLPLNGTAVLVDRLALEKLNDPLMHLLRNAFDHGIESPEERRAAGKPETGTIEISALHQGNQTIIEIRDDGGGLNPDKILQRAIKRGLVTQEQGDRLTPEQIQNLIFEPNFSTADQVSELSGRGVGLDVVRQQLQALKGNVVVSSRLGRGSTFSLRLPLTLTIAKLLVCLVGQSNTPNAPLTAIAIPSDSVAELLVPLSSQIKTSGGQRFLLWQHLTVPIYPLHQLLPYNCAVSERQASKLLTSVPQPEDWSLPMILLRLGDQYFALEVNRLVTEQELVIKPFSPILQAPNYLYGSTILADGTLIPVVNGSLLLEWHWQQGSDNLAAVDLALEAIDGEDLTTESAQTSTILVVDDSAALRRTLAFTLEKSGYRVVQAKDGQEALKTLGQTTDIDLIICDVEMPNLNGFEFLGQRRRNPDFLKIPVAMLTSRGSDKHRQLAMTLGANAYFTKPYIEQQFLVAVKNLLAGQLVSV
ncbi:MAG: response regulator, partial [Synechocystis sp.]